jgi:hypothetical protein
VLKFIHDHPKLAVADSLRKRTAAGEDCNDLMRRWYHVELRHALGISPLMLTTRNGEALRNDAQKAWAANCPSGRLVALREMRGILTAMELHLHFPRELEMDCFAALVCASCSVQRAACILRRGGGGGGGGAAGVGVQVAVALQRAWLARQVVVACGCSPAIAHSPSQDTHPQTHAHAYAHEHASTRTHQVLCRTDVDRDGIIGIKQFIGVFEHLSMLEALYEFLVKKGMLVLDLHV